jgi:hypothetical protein
MRWCLTWRADPRLAALADRHYSRKSHGASQFAPPGSVVCLITADGLAGWVTWRTDYPDADWLRDAWCCTLFRNEGGGLSSSLIREAVAATRAKWGEPPSGGTVTTVDASKVRHKRDPGRCFLRAGFYRLPELTKDRGLVILRLAVADHPPALPAGNTQLRPRGMKALPLWQPWATLVAIGAKHIETRDYPPARLGLQHNQQIAIHACKGNLDRWACRRTFFADHLPNPGELPLGAIIATCRIVRATLITEQRAEELLERCPEEFAFGNYLPGRWAWRLDDVVQLPEPVPFRGSQGTFDVPDELLGAGPVQGALL